MVFVGGENNTLPILNNTYVFRRKKRFAHLKKNTNKSMIRGRNALPVFNKTPTSMFSLEKRFAYQQIQKVKTLSKKTFSKRKS